MYFVISENVPAFARSLLDYNSLQPSPSPLRKTTVTLIGPVCWGSAALAALLHEFVRLAAAYLGGVQVKHLALAGRAHILSVSRVHQDRTSSFPCVDRVSI
jgi:hypothetical protein